MRFWLESAGMELCLRLEHHMDEMQEIVVKCVLMVELDWTTTAAAPLLVEYVPFSQLDERVYVLITNTIDTT